MPIDYRTQQNAAQLYNCLKMALGQCGDFGTISLIDGPICKASMLLLQVTMHAFISTAATRVHVGPKSFQPS